MTMTAGTFPVGAMTSAPPSWRPRALIAALAGVGGALLIAGSLLPWLSLYAGVDTISGIGGMNGRLLFSAGAVSAALGLLSIWRPSKQLQYGMGAVGFVASGFAAWVVSQVLGSYQQLQGDPFVLASLGVGTFVALGGALTVLSTLLVPRSPAAGRAPHPLPMTTSAQGDARTVLLSGVVAFLVSAAMIHLAVVGPHLHESTLYAAFFVSAAVVQLVAALTLTMGRHRRLLLTIALGNALVIVIWVVSRTVGLPIGPTPGVAESVSLPDVLATAAESAIVALSIALVVIRRPVLTRRWIIAGAVIAVPMIAVVTTVVAIIAAQAGGG